MRLLNRISIKARFVLSFALMLMLFIQFAGFAIWEMNRLGEFTTTLYEHPLRVSNRSLKASMGVVRMHRTMKDLSTAESEMEIQAAVRSVENEQAKVLAHLKVVGEQILGEEGARLLVGVREQFAAWKPVRDEVIGLVMAGKRTEAIRLTKGMGADHVALLEGRMLALNDYARNKGDLFMAGAKASGRAIVLKTFVIIGVVALLAFLIALLTGRSILLNVASLTKTMADITETGELKPSKLAGQNEIVEMADHFNRVIEQLRRQLWIRDGLNRLNDALAGGLSAADLSETGMRFLARHVESCMGALYTFDRRTKACELAASFARMDAGHKAGSFAMGEGLVGQVAAEKRSILLTKVDRSDALCVTGTASQPPRNIYAMPLVHEGALQGVLEIATFAAIDGMVREFLDAAGKVLATQLHTAEQGEEIRALYDKTEEANRHLEERTGALDAANDRLSGLNDELRRKSRTQERQAEELTAQKSELEIQRLQVQEADRLKSEFLSNMSHELRTPLNSILALSQLMLSRGTGNDPNQEGEYLKVVERNGRQLLSLINDILDLSKIEAGRMDLYLSEFEPETIVAKALETVSLMAEEKGLMLAVRGDAGGLVASDEEKVYQVVLNLFSNAIKFTDEGSVNATIRQEDDGIVFEITDTGIGIGADELPHIFDEFRQVDGSTTRSQGGTGLGLAICRKLAVLLGGDITARSTFGRGSTFTFRLPRGCSGQMPAKGAREAENGIARQSAGNSAVPQPAAGEDPGRGTVLVIDDDRKMRKLMAGHLTRTGYRVVTAENGRKGLAAARKERPMAITLDVLMPEMDGWETLRALKSKAETADIPVVMVSVSDDRAAGMALGADGYIVKPVASGALVREIARVGGLGPVRRIMVVDDDHLMRGGLKAMLEAEAYQIEEAASGERALEMALASPPDLMILDLVMPGMDGFAVLEGIRQARQTRDLPVIILTARDLDRDEQDRLKAAVHRVITKGGEGAGNLMRDVRQTVEKIERLEKRGSAAGSPCILVVEDNPTAALQIRTTLEEGGYGVFVAPGGQEAIEQVRRKIPDAVVLDLMMPGVDGFAVLEEIRSTPETAHLPVLVLTAKALTVEDRARLSHNNVRELVQKGALDRGQLLKRVEKLLTTDSRIGLSMEREAACVSSSGSVSGTTPTSAVGQKASATLLIVEDNPDNLLTIEAILAERKYRLIRAGDGATACEKAAGGLPDLILMDVQLPEVSGIEAARRIKSDAATAHIPVIAVTAKAMRGDREAILAAGCDDYVSKPIEPSKLFAAIDRCLKPIGGL